MYAFIHVNYFIMLKKDIGLKIVGLNYF